MAVIAVSQSPEPFASCHSEGAKRLKNLAQGKLREGTAKQFHIPSREGIKAINNFPLPRWERIKVRVKSW